MIIIRNPWGLDNTYNQTWRANGTKWTAFNITQMPLDVNPSLSQTTDGVIVLPISFMSTFFDE